MNKLIKRLIIYGCLIFVVLGSVNWIINKKIKFTVISNVFYNNPRHKLWAHKGYTKPGETYRVNRLKQAVDDGIVGVELDLYYSAELQKFLVAHDFPINDTLFLDDYLIPSGNQLCYWFDLKNLKNADLNQISGAFTRINKKFKLNNKFIIESKEGCKLGKLNNLGFHTCFWINTPEKSDFLKFYFWKIKNRYQLLTNNFNAISMPYYSYKSGDYHEFENLPIHTWIDNKSLSTDSLQIINNPNLKIVLFDNQK